MSSYEPGSRAITIPLHPSSLRAATTRRTRSKVLDRTDSSEAGPSSLSSRDSSWSSPNGSAHSMRHRSSRKPGYRHPGPDNAMDAGHEYKGSENKMKDKLQDQRPATPPSQMPAHIHNSPLGPSMMASSSYKSINLSSHNDRDEPPRLITYTKHSQGFTWNDELFLPGYLLGRYGGRRRRLRWDDDDDDQMDDIMDSNDPERCPVTEIFVTDEEAAAMMP